MNASPQTKRTYVYVLESQKDGWLYVGRAADLIGRFYLHSADLMAPTRHRGPFRLAYFQACPTPQVADKETRRLKSNGLSRNQIETFQRERALI